MGRKSKSKLVLNQQANKGSNLKKNDELVKLQDLTDQLLRICSGILPSTSAKLWEEHVSLVNILDQIIKLEEGVYFPDIKRAEKFSAFLEWVKEEGVDLAALKIEFYGEESWGLQAEIDIQGGQLWLTIPRNLMLTSGGFKDTSLERVLSKDPISKHFPQVALALNILKERLDRQSKFKHYLDILPNRYDTILYFSISEFEELKGCSCLDDALKHYRHIARQYAYYWQLFSKVEDSTFNLKKNFSFNLYRWAVSTVMTRQNAIPSSDGSETLIALVPLWDMCNHKQGKVLTDFNLESNSLECYADRDFKKNEQIFISYGDRPNSEFFIHNAFVYLNNPYDKVALKLGISKNDSLMTQKINLLQQININQNDTFYIVNDSNPVSDRLLAFIRIFVMTESDLSEICDDISQLCQRLNFLEKQLSSDIHKRSWNFLKIRLELLLKSFKTSMEEDEALLKGKDDMSSPIRLGIEMRLSEKRLLRQALNYATTQCAHHD